MNEKRISRIVFPGLTGQSADHVVRAFCSVFPSLDTVGGCYLLTDALDGRPEGLDRALECASNAQSWPGSWKMEGEEVVLIPHIGDRVIRISADRGAKKGRVRIVADYSRRPSVEAVRPLLPCLEYGAGGKIEYAD